MGSTDRIEVLRHERALPGVVLYRGTAATHPYPRHWHDELHLCAYTWGAGRLRLRGATQTVGAGDLILTPIGEVHENWVDRGEACSFRSVYLPPELMRNFARQTAGSARFEPVFAEIRLRAPAVRRALFALHRAVAGEVVPLEAEDALVTLCRELLRGCAETTLVERRFGRERRAVRLARAYIEEHVAESVTLARLAEVTRLSPFYLHRVFCRETGMPPHAFQVQARVNRAKRLIRDGMPLAEVAATAGFADQAHLTRHFRRLVGMPPGRFRR